MNITLIRSNKRKNSTTYNSAEYLISKLENVDKVYEFTLPEDMPHICCGCYACIKGDEEKCGGYKYLKPSGVILTSQTTFGIFLTSTFTTSFVFVSIITLSQQRDPFNLFFSSIYLVLFVS